MKKMARLVCVALVLTALLSVDIEWPAMLASAEGTDAVQQDGREEKGT